MWGYRDVAVHVLSCSLVSRKYCIACLRHIIRHCIFFENVFPLPLDVLIMMTCSRLMYSFDVFHYDDMYSFDALLG